MLRAYPELYFPGSIRPDASVYLIFQALAPQIVKRFVANDRKQKRKHELDLFTGSHLFPQNGHGFSGHTFGLGRIISIRFRKQDTPLVITVEIVAQKSYVNLI